MWGYEEKPMKREMKKVKNKGGHIETNNKISNNNQKHIYVFM